MYKIYDKLKKTWLAPSLSALAYLKKSFIEAFLSNQTAFRGCTCKKLILSKKKRRRGKHDD
jgi:hypothetical protein